MYDCGAETATCAASKTFPGMPGMSLSGRKCEYRLQGVNVRSCGIAEVHRNMGNVTFWPVLTVPSGARVAILS